MLPARVVLVGMMGSGKSSVGRLLAQRTGWPFLDNDALVEGATGMSARDLLVRDGEEALRHAESDALLLGLSEAAPCIVAAAAGTILDADTRASIAEPLVVWLTARPETLARRAAGATHRPWLDGDPVAWMERTLDERAALYQSVADLVFDTDGRRADEVAEEILTWLSSSPAYH